MAEFKNVSILMGAVDETESLENAVSEILRLCKPDDIKEIIILKAPHITSECEAVVNRIKQEDEKGKIVVANQKKRGIGALVELFDIAKGSHCMIVASDNALDLECVPQMIEKAKENGDIIVKTSRWLPGCRFINYSRSRYVMNYLGQKFLTVLFGRKMTDFTNPNQIVPTEIYRSIKWESMGFPILLELVLKPLRLGCRFVEIPTNCYGRKQGKSSNSFRQTAKYFSTALHIRFMKKQDLLK
ncbi:MAG: glycosyltransferase [Clostridia bacterium]|nr:glycosyltransferase [Clostridia bacterium]